MRGSDITIAEVASDADMQAVIALFLEYAGSLGIDLSYQDFDGELSSMPGKYVPPYGALFLARQGGGSPVGCVAMRPLAETGICEMKRLYVMPHVRGGGLGRRLAVAAIDAAEKIGHTEIRLDTLPSMTRALQLYLSLGFETMPPYYETPVAGTIFVRKFLKPKAPIPRESP